jgi:hypothetical protein
MRPVGLTMRDNDPRLPIDYANPKHEEELREHREKLPRQVIGVAAGIGLTVLVSPFVARGTDAPLIIWGLLFPFAALVRGAGVGVFFMVAALQWPTLGWLVGLSIDFDKPQVPWVLGTLYAIAIPLSVAVQFGW